MDQMIGHPPWCHRVDCSTTGRHVSLPESAGKTDDLVGIEVALVQLDAPGLSLVELSLTDDGVTTTVTIPERQARNLEQVLNHIVTG